MIGLEREQSSTMIHMTSAWSSHLQQFERRHEKDATDLGTAITYPGHWRHVNGHLCIASSSPADEPACAPYCSSVAVI